MKRHDLEHQIWKKIKEHGLEQKRLMVGFSGGIDSVALLGLLQSVHHPKIAGFYFHHGDFENENYRDRAAVFCEKMCQSLAIPFFTIKNSRFAKSEAELRTDRYHAFQEIMKQEGYELIALAHHRDDLLETRLLRLIRGTGGQGLHAMAELSFPYFRPLLEVSKNQLLEYLKLRQLEYIDDPSNSSTDPMRNWLREAWLKPLAERQIGAIDSLARSLELISQELEGFSDQDLLQKNNELCREALSRGYFLSLSSKNQLKLLAQYLLFIGKSDFSHSQLKEVQKRLDNAEKEYTFDQGRMRWVVNAGQIKVQ